ncbi:MAG: response regulator [Bacteroidales bacterium]|nr:response regulator [Bacteroidales bacterium]
MSDYKVLIVEDELLVAADIEESLEILGYRVIGSVATGKDALQKVNEQLPDIILMDIMLKGDMTGIDTANAIRQKHDVPIVYLTANADISTIEKAKVSLPYGYIIKPFTEKDLQTNIEIARFKFNNDIKIKMESDQYNRFFSFPADNQEKFIFVDAEKGLEKLSSDKIYYVEATDDFSTIYTADEDLVIKKTIAEIEKTLPVKNFCRVTDDCIVNTDKIFLSKLPEIIIAEKMTVFIVDEDKIENLESRLKAK